MTNFTNNFELNKAHHDSFFKKASDNDIEKSGEGSKGGTVIGHTSTGKPIYAHRPYEHHSKEELHKLADKKAGRDRMNAINELSLRYEQVSGKKASSLALDRKEPFITKPESNIEKGGEGSRGGKIIGHTKSGKAIYDTASHESHKDFTPEDHNDAYKIHHDQMFDDRDRTQHHRTQRDVHSSQSDLKSKKAYEEKLATRKIAEKNKVEIDKLNKERKQLLIDMEQEAEPEGGSIADMYGRKLDRIDNKIDKLKGIKKSEDTDSLQKAFEVLGLPDAYDQIEKGGKPALVGEIRDFGGKKMIKTKMGSNSWRPYFPGGKHEHLTSGDKKEPAKEEVKTEPRAEKKEPESPHSKELIKQLSSAALTSLKNGFHFNYQNTERRGEKFTSHLGENTITSTDSELTRQQNGDIIYTQKVSYVTANGTGFSKDRVDQRIGRSEKQLSDFLSTNPEMADKLRKEYLSMTNRYKRLKDDFNTHSSHDRNHYRVLQKRGAGIIPSELLEDSKKASN